MTGVVSSSGASPNGDRPQGIPHSPAAASKGTPAPFKASHGDLKVDRSEGRNWDGHGPVPAILVTEPTPPPPSAQRPRGHRQRRTTLPRSTRGWSRAIVWSLIGLTGFGVVYGSLARIDTSINANGKLRPIGGVNEISSSLAGRVQQVLVKEGQWVETGQLLLKLEDRVLLQQRQDLLSMQQLWTKEAQLLAQELGLADHSLARPAERREWAVETGETALREKLADQERQRSMISLKQQFGDLRTLRQKYSINDSITHRMQALVRQGAMAQLELDRQNERQLELLNTIRRSEHDIQAGRRKVQESVLNRPQITAANAKQLYPLYDNARQQLLDLSSRLLDLNERIRLSQLRSPGRGRIFDLRIKPAETVQAHMPLMKLIPDRDLEAELSISNRDIGFLSPGMPVEVRVTSFPFTDFGSLKGRLVRVGADVLPADPKNPQDYFPAIVQLERNELDRRGRHYSLRPGMAVTALIQLGARPVISLISDRFGGFMESTRSIR